MPNKENFTNIDEFLAWYAKKRPETVYLIKNKIRYAEVMEAVKTICDFAVSSNPGGTTFTAEPDSLLGTSVCIEIVSDLVVFEDMQTLCSALSKANNFEIRSMGRGKALIGIVFQDVYDLAPPSKK